MNDSQVTIVICWEPGTDEMLTACLKSICRHTKDVPYRVLLVSRDTDESFYHTPVLTDHEASFEIGRTEIHIPVDPGINPLRIHGALLDAAIPKHVFTEYVLTLDSDCFPVADGWLSGLVAMLRYDGVHVAGILHPWSPPSPEVNQKRLEWRLRSQLCWNNSHVSCQLMRTDDVKLLRSEGHSYGTGDDTGLGMATAASARNWKTEGYRVSRSPIPMGTELDPEFNRYSSLVYGDMVYHHGGATRTVVSGDRRVFARSFQWCEKLVLWGHGAEFLLEPEFSYPFKFDREEEVAAEKMNRVFGLDSQQMPG